MSQSGAGRAHAFAAVERAAKLLAGEGLAVWLFGGWAEERLRLADPWEHGDVDFLYVAPDFRELDVLIAHRGWQLEKRLPHKRAILLNGLTVDLFLVQQDDEGYFTQFDGWRHRWPNDVVSDPAELAVASAAAVQGFRAAFEQFLERGRAT